MTKRNAMGEAYCLTANEARAEIEKGNAGWAIYCPGDIMKPEPPRFGATAEIVENFSGELVCYVEAPDEAGVRALLKELKIEVMK